MLQSLTTKLHLPRHTLRSRMILALSLVALLQALLLGGYASYHLAETLEEQIGKRALQMARAIAVLPSVVDGVRRRDSVKLQSITQHLLANSDARFIVIGDHSGIRFAHPVPERIGQAMKGGDNDRALLHGEYYISKATGTLGPSVRGKAPVLDQRGDIIGIVSVGYLVDNISSRIAHYQQSIIAVTAIGLLLSMLAAVWISRYFKRAIFGLEPEQIGQLYEERNATLESVREGIIAVNPQGIISTFNREAVRMFGLADGASLEGRHISEIFPNTTILTLLETGEPQFDRELYRNNRVLIANRIPIFNGTQPVGVVSSYRYKDELDRVSDKLSQTEQYAETLRSQAHEYSNKLHTIAGLIELGANAQALDLISQETRDHQALIHFLTRAVEDPILSGCLLGKFNRAKELGLSLVIDPESAMGTLPEHIDAKQLVTVLGNLLDNAFEASRKTASDQVQLSMTDIGQDLIFEVEDQGPGIPAALEQQIFDKGFSSKPEDGHGWGLYLAKQIVSQLKGDIILAKPPGGGTRITIYLPKESQRERD